MGRSVLEFVTVPTSDTPGTLMSFRFQDGSRYLIGRFAESTSRACVEENVGLARVAASFVTGNTRWENIGGLIGMLLSISDAKSASHASHLESNKDYDASIKVLGPKNLNRALAAGRKFIFRTGCPLTITELDPANADTASMHEPTWKDENLLVWALPVLSDGSNAAAANCASSRKRTFDEASSTDTPQPSDIVSLMFNSTWKYERLVPQPLSSVPSATTCYVLDPNTKDLTVYNGPRPTVEQAAEDITVFARAPWPGSTIVDLPAAKPAPECVSYIFRTYPTRGKFDPNKAQELNVPKGRAWAELTSGKSVENTHGETITPDMVLGPTRPGTGFAVIDLIDETYIDGLVNRPEWASQTTTEGLVAIVWIVSSDVWNDSRLRQFRQRFSDVQHILCSSKYTPDTFAFEKAAANATRHRLLEPSVFPALWHQSNPQFATDVIVARKNMSVTIDPKFELDSEQIPPPLTLVSVQDDFKRELKKYPRFADAFESIQRTQLGPTDSELLPYSDVEITVLGTGSSHPSPYRNVSGIAVEIPDWGKCLLDCGEGTLNNLWRIVAPEDRANWFSDLNMIWISHLHADHHLGTFSVIKEWDKATRDDSERKLAIVSDRAMSKWLHEYFSVDDPGILSRLLLIQAAPVPQGFQRPQEQTTALILLRPETEVDKGLARLVNDESTSAQEIMDKLKVKLFNAVFVDHCKGAMAVSITFPSGFKISYSGDCIASLSFAKQGRDSHVVIHEATLEDELRVEAISKKHSTPGEALIVAAEMRAKVCLLTHFSQRYPTMPPLGVDVGRKGAYSDVKQVEDVLADDQDEIEANSEPGMTDVLPQKEDATQVEGVSEDPAISHLLDAPVARSRNKARVLSKVKLIDQAVVQQFIDKVELKVIFAFDYMRFRLGQLPQIERVQPVLRQMYDHGIGNDVRMTPHQQSVRQLNLNKTAARERQKEEKRRQINQSVRKADKRSMLKDL